MVEEEKLLEFAGIKVFKKLVNMERCYDVLDDRIKSDHAYFKPLPRKLTPVEKVLKEKIEKLTGIYNSKIAEIWITVDDVVTTCQQMWKNTRKSWKG